MLERQGIYRRVAGAVHQQIDAIAPPVAIDLRYAVLCSLNRIDTPIDLAYAQLCVLQRTDFDLAFALVHAITTVANPVDSQGQSLPGLQLYADAALSVPLESLQRLRCNGTRVYQASQVANGRLCQVFELLSSGWQLRNDWTLLNGVLSFEGSPKGDILCVPYNSLFHLFLDQAEVVIPLWLVQRDTLLHLDVTVAGLPLSLDPVGPWQDTLQITSLPSTLWVKKPAQVSAETFDELIVTSKAFA